MRSVRARVTALAVVMVTIVLVGTAAALVGIERRELLSSFDVSLRQRAVMLAAALDPSDARLVDADREDGFVQLVNASGEVVDATANVADQPALVGPPAGSVGDVGTVEVPVDEDAFRVLAYPTDDGGYLVIGESIDDVVEAVGTLGSTLVLVLPLVVLVLGLLVWWLVGRALGPAEAIRAEVAGIGPGELDRRVPDPGTGDELARLAGTMNDMLDRLQSASERQQRFTADASHELRTPLTRIRAELEVELAKGDAEHLRRAVRRAMRDVDEMEAMLDQLLFLARTDSASIARKAPVDLDVLVEREVCDQRAAGGSSDVVIDTSEVEAVVVDGDELQLARLVRNLLSNAVRHATSEVSVQVSRAGERACLVVSDDGSGIPLAERARVLERFTLLDDARRRGDGGVGLGLAIVDAVVRAHGGELRVEGSERGGARIVVLL